MVKGVNNCIIVGLNSLSNEDDSIIIGDNITFGDMSQKDVIYIGDNIVIGKTLFGKEFKLKKEFDNILRRMKLERIKK